MANEILRTLLPLAGWTDERTNELSITGGTDPILPTSFRIGESSAAALGALGLAVSDLWEDWTPPGGVGRYPPGHSVAAQRKIYAYG